MHLYAQLTPLGIDVFGIENSKAALDFQVAQIILDRLLKFVKQYHLNVFPSCGNYDTATSCAYGSYDNKTC